MLREPKTKITLRLMESMFCIVACDVDGDGREEIYFLNTNTYSGSSDTGDLDKLFRFNDEIGQFEDILSKDYNIGVLRNLAGRSVACIDRTGSLYLPFYLKTIIY